MRDAVALDAHKQSHNAVFTAGDASCVELTPATAGISPDIVLPTPVGVSTAAAQPSAAPAVQPAQAKNYHDAIHHFKNSGFDSLDMDGTLRAMKLLAEANLWIKRSITEFDTADQNDPAVLQKMAEWNSGLSLARHLVEKCYTRYNFLLYPPSPPPSPAKQDNSAKGQGLFPPKGNNVNTGNTNVDNVNNVNIDISSAHNVKNSVKHNVPNVKNPGTNSGNKRNSRTNTTDDDGFRHPPKRMTAKNPRGPFFVNPISVVRKDVDVDVPLDMDTSTPSTSQTTPPTKVRKEKKPPPFLIVPDPSWDSTLAYIRQSYAPSAFCRMAGTKIKLMVATAQEYRAVQGFLTNANTRFCTYQLDEERPFKLVIRGLPACTNPDSIVEFFKAAYNIEVTVTPMYKGPKSKRVAMPLFYLQVPKRPSIELDELYRVADINGMQVSLERYKGLRGPAQCHRCQGFFHSAQACRMPPKCVRCAKGHLSKDCPVKDLIQPCVCANCNGDHPASFRSCPKFPRPAQKKRGPRKVERPFTSNKASTALSYANAARGVSTTVTPTSIPAARSDQTPVPRNEPAPSAPAEALQDADMIASILKFEERYDRAIILQAFENSLPALRSASTNVDRTFIMYKGILALVSQG